MPSAFGGKVKSDEEKTDVDSKDDEKLAVPDAHVKVPREVKKGKRVVPKKVIRTKYDVKHISGVEGSILHCLNLTLDEAFEFVLYAGGGNTGSDIHSAMASFSFAGESNFKEVERDEVLKYVEDAPSNFGNFWRITLNTSPYIFYNFTQEALFGDDKSLIAKEFEFATKVAFEVALEHYIEFLEGNPDLYMFSGPMEESIRNELKSQLFLDVISPIDKAEINDNVDKVREAYLNLRVPVNENEYVFKVFKFMPWTPINNYGYDFEEKHLSAMVTLMPEIPGPSSAEAGVAGSQALNATMQRLEQMLSTYLQGYDQRIANLEAYTMNIYQEMTKISTELLSNEEE
jgi:hypothetical protein